MNQRLVSVLANVFNLRSDQIIIDLRKENVGSWDSLKQMDLVVSLEKEFSINLEISDIVKMDSVRNIMTVLADKGIHFED
ncbi:acyl carrier protein [Legionella sp. km772]|uniref:acyl carrier protein n=1 Tax=Legionella sp. km772 TaxID=2498111 RepID=UPI000F8F54B2|nr:acyl carrier protein [Legionella sp. km772]RUR08742.1 acyl carrier protein [Legionella sp. km772]